MRRIFLSASGSEFPALITSLARRLDRLDDVKTIDQRRLGSRPEELASAIAAECSRSNVFVGIFGHHDGDIQNGAGVPLGRWAYQQAHSLNVPCLIYLAHGAEAEFDEATREFRALLRSHHAVGTFVNECDLISTLQS